jgi:hypothetical protein
MYIPKYGILLSFDMHIQEYGSYLICIFQNVFDKMWNKKLENFIIIWKCGPLVRSLLIIMKVRGFIPNFLQPICTIRGPG